jgi:hypothetical protein
VGGACGLVHKLSCTEHDWCLVANRPVSQTRFRHLLCVCSDGTVYIFRQQVRDMGVDSRSAFFVHQSRWTEPVNNRIIKPNTIVIHALSCFRSGKIKTSQSNQIPRQNRTTPNAVSNSMPKSDPIMNNQTQPDY